MEMKYYNQIGNLANNNSEAFRMLNDIFKLYWIKNNKEGKIDPNIDPYFSYQYLHDQKYKDIRKKIEEIAECFDLEIIDAEFKKTSTKIAGLGHVFQEFGLWKVNNIYVTIEILKKNRINKSPDHFAKSMKDYLVKLNKDSKYISKLITQEKVNQILIEHKDHSSLFFLADMIMLEEYITRKKSHRVYSSSQNLPEKFREIIFPRSENFREIDISACHLTLFTKITGEKVDRAKIAKDLQLPEEKVKEVINMTLYGAGESKLEKVAGYDQIKENKTYIKLKKAQTKLFNQLVDVKNKTVNPFLFSRYGIPLPDSEYIFSRSGKSPQAVCGHYFFTSFERFVLCSAINELVKKYDDDQIRIALDQHDGVTLFFGEGSTDYSIDSKLLKLQGYLKKYEHEMFGDLDRMRETRTVRTNLKLKLKE